MGVVSQHNAFRHPLPIPCPLLFCLRFNAFCRMSRYGKDSKSLPHMKIAKGLTSFCTMGQAFRLRVGFGGSLACLFASMVFGFLAERVRF